MSAANELEALHLRARAFIAASARGEAPAEAFDALGLDLARFQARASAPYARLLAARGAEPSRARALAELPAVPTDAFKLTRIAAHPPELDAITFRTSGTTIGARGEHHLTTTATYEAAARAWGAFALFPDAPPRLHAIVLAPPPEEAPDSSLGFMIERFAAWFCAAATWVVRGGAIALDAMHGAAAEAARAGDPVVLLGTSFAFVHALDGLGARRVPLPPGSRAMQTGGYKGRSRVVAPAELRQSIARAFDLDEAAVVSEYGMTELSSQLWEGTLRGRLGLPTPSARCGVLLAPPWVRVVPVDPERLAPVAAGEVGVLRIEDLANVDGAVAIQTADRGRLVDGGVELLGRAEGAPPRGCSIAADEILGR